MAAGDKMFNLIVFVLAEVTIISCSVTCRNEQGRSVDWFIVYKLPELQDDPNEHIRSGYAYYYTDVLTRQWIPGKVLLNETAQAVGYTLQQIYKNHTSKDLMYLLYNDEVPEGHKSGHNNHGHTKGDLCFDKSSGFWLVHSVPKFPPNASTRYHYPPSGRLFGQMFLCVTYKYRLLDQIGKQMLYNYPKIYDFNLPESFEADNPNIKQVLEGAHIKQSPWNHTMSLVSAGGQTFTSFAKFSSYDEDLYHDWLAPYYESDVYVESWLNGIHPLSSNCTGKYKAFNIMQLNVSHVTFKSSRDHSKWAVTGKRNYTCIGDINRMQSQEKRAGGTVCFQIAHISRLFTESIINYQSCPKIFDVNQPTVITAK